MASEYRLPFPEEVDLIDSKKLRRYRKVIQMFNMPVWRWLIVLLSVAVSTAIRFALNPWLEGSSPFVIFFLGILASATVAGFCGGVLATFLSVPIAWYYFLPEQWSFKLLNPSSSAGLGVFVLEGIIFSFFAGFFRETTLAVGRELSIAEGKGRDTSQELVESKQELQDSKASEAKLKDLSETLRQSEKSFRLLLDAVKTYGIFFFDDNGIISVWNSGAQKLTGYSAEEAIGKHISLIFTEEDCKARIPEKEMETARTRGVAADERWHQRKSGAIFWGSGTVSPLKDAEGNLRGFVKVVTDATLQKEAQDLRKNEQEWLEAALNLLPVPMFFADAGSGAIRFANKAFIEMSGEIPKNSYLPEGHKLTDAEGNIISFEDLPGARAERGENVADAEMLWHTKNTVYSIMVSARLLPAMHGHSQTVVATITDVTHLKEVEADLKKANEAKSEFLANMSHEIRTPLGAILGFTDLLRDPNLSAQERSHFGEVIARNGKLLLQLINDILDLSKIESGNLQVEHLTVSLRELITDIETLFKPKASGKGVELKVLPVAQGVPLEVCTDPTRVKQILMNVVSNALKFTEKGSVTIELGMYDCPVQGKPCLGFKVSDTGVGIPEDKQALLFQPFMQADPSVTRKFGGTGLGLALSKKIARALGGDLVLIKSVPGKGSVFLATLNVLPAHLCQDDSHREIPDAEKGFAQSKRLKDLSVLLVEDSPDNQALISIYLKREGVKLEMCSDGESAVKLASEKPFDLILMDIQLPGMDGYTAIRKLRASGIQTTIVALTAHALAEEKEKCVEAGCDGFLTKPIYRETLIHEIEKMFGARTKTADKEI